MVHSEDIYKSFYNVIKPITGFKVVQAFIDDFIIDTNKKFKNQIVITPPTLPSENLTFDEDFYKGDSSITIEIFASTMKSATIAYDELCTKLLSNKGDLIVGNIKLGASQPSSVIEGGTSIKIIPIIVSFDYRFSL